MAWEPFGVGPKPEKVKGQKQRPFAGKVIGFMPARRAEVSDGKVVIVDDEPSSLSVSAKYTFRWRGA